MLRFSSICTVSVLALAACGGEDEEALSDPAEATVELTQDIGERQEGFPCPPFTNAFADEADVYGDDDSDGLTNCQEDEIGTDRGNDDADGDGIPDGVEVPDPGALVDTDGDGDPNVFDDDDDGDGCPTIDEGVADVDKDKIPAYLDPNETDPAVCPSATTTTPTGDTGDTGTTDTDTDTTDTDTDTGTTDTGTGTTDTGTSGETGDTGSTS